MESTQIHRAYRSIVNCGLSILLMTCWLPTGLNAQSRISALVVKVNAADGSYAIAAPGTQDIALRAVDYHNHLDALEPADFGYGTFRRC